MESVDDKRVEKKTDSKFNQEIHSEIVRAGKRTYFMDVKSTRNNEYYLTITESKKRYGENGKFHYEKHKIFLYKEDFENFADSLQDVLDYIRKNQPEQESIHEAEMTNKKPEEKVDSVSETEKSFSDIDFEDI